uniref:Peptidase A1 domain-containing protein n=1 Tax=Aegilops tauschii subsp. strangulata TaxID=200361 RepID=A0A453FD95_AEGTS
MAGRRLALLLVAVAAAFLAGASGRRASDSARFPLLRLAAPASLADLARSDRQRMAFIASHGRRRTRETAAGSSASSAAAAFAMPLTSGAYTGIGQYFVRFRVGTPAQPFLLVADTGSDLTWVKCRRPASASAPANSSLSPADSGSGRAFRPEDSRTWAPISCASDTCTKSLPFSLATCPTPGSPCAYDYRYKDGSAARGTVGTESATIALSGREERKAKLKGLVLGCTSSYTGPSFEASDGVLSLGYSGISFASHAASRFGGRFSYCLVDHLSPRNATSYLTFGPNRSPRAHDAAAARPPYAPLLRRQPQGHLRRRGVPQDTARRLGRRGGGRRHPRLRHQPHGAGQAGLPRRRGRAQQGARRAAAGHHGPVRVLLQLDVAVGRGRRRRCAEDGRALRRGGAAGAPREELRDRRGARRQVHRPAGRPLARDLRHR